MDSWVVIRTRKASRIPLPISPTTGYPGQTCDELTLPIATSRALPPSKDYQSHGQTEEQIKTRGTPSPIPTNAPSNTRSTRLPPNTPTIGCGAPAMAPAPPEHWSPCQKLLAFINADSKTRRTLATNPPECPHCTAFSEREWAFTPTEEPLSQGMKDEVRMELKKYYRFYRRDQIFRMETKWSWMCKELILELRSSTSIRPLDPGQLAGFCNKPTSLYWAHSTQRGDRCTTLPFGCIYKEWFRYHDGDPYIEFGHFFANPIHITSTGPATIAGILQAHQSLCDQASSLLSKIGRGEAPNVYPFRWPNPCHYALLPLCRAIIVILDELVTDIGIDPEGFISLDKESQRQSVIMVRTGHESALSAPISYECISGQFLPLDRSDITMNDPIDAVRVSLATAVRFIAALQQREEAAFPHLRDQSVVEASLCPSTGDHRYIALTADAWADKIMQEAEEKGIDNILEAKEAVGRVKAAKVGKVYNELMPYHFNLRWK